MQINVIVEKGLQIMAYFLSMAGIGYDLNYLPDYTIPYKISDLILNVAHLELSS